MGKWNRQRLVTAIRGQPEIAGIVSEVAPEVNLAVLGQGSTVRVAGADLYDFPLQLNLA